VWQPQPKKKPYPWSKHQGSVRYRGGQTDEGIKRHNRSKGGRSPDQNVYVMGNHKKPGLEKDGGGGQDTKATHQGGGFPRAPPKRRRRFKNTSKSKKPCFEANTTRMVNKRVRKKAGGGDVGHGKKDVHVRG